MRRALIGAVSAFALAGCHHARPEVAPPPPPPVAAEPAPVKVPDTQKFLASGEAAAISIQAWRQLVSYVGGQLHARPLDSVILARDATIEAPKYVPCGAKPYAAVFDVDETILINAGWSYDQTVTGRSYDQARWEVWEKTGAHQVQGVPGAANAMAALRNMGVTPVFISNRKTENGAQAVEALKFAGMGDAVPGETLFLQGEDATGTKKDERRWKVAEKFCVLAAGGDQLTDFTTLLDPLSAAARRAAVEGPLAKNFGAGWFVMPNPTYGTSLKGGLDDTFPPSVRWREPKAGE